MEKPEISEEVKEQYLDASAAMFMEQYAALLHGDADLAEGDFPEELDVRCRKLIKREKEKRSRKRMLHRVAGVCRRVAVFALVLLSLGTTLFLTVESFRQPLMNKYIEWKGGYIEISAKHDEVANEVDLNDPLRQMLSEEFVLDVIINELHHGMMMACYKSPTQDVNLFIEDMSGVSQTDTEDAVITETYVMGQEVLMISKENMYRLNWVDEQKGWIFSLHTTNVSVERTIDLCSEIIVLFEDVSM